MASMQQVAPPKREPNEPVMIIEQILQKRLLDDGTPLYLLRWLGRGPAHDTWEPAEHVYCPAALAEFEAACLH